MTENKLKLVGALCGAALMAVFGLGIYGVTACSSRQNVQRAIAYCQNDENYRTVIGRIEHYEKESDLYVILINVESEDTYDISRGAVVGNVVYMYDLPKTSVKVMESNGFEFAVGAQYMFTVTNVSPPADHASVMRRPIVFVSTVTGSKVYLEYEVGKLNVINYLNTLK